MSTEAHVEGVVIDVCTRSFLLLSDNGEERWIECNTTEEFMNVMKVCTSRLKNDQIEYADLAVRAEKN